MKVYKSKRTNIEIEILKQNKTHLIYKVLSGKNIGYIGMMSVEELIKNWRGVKMTDEEKIKVTKK